MYGNLFVQREERKTQKIRMEISSKKFRIKHREIRTKKQCKKNSYGIEVKVASKVLKVHRRGRCYDIALRIFELYFIRLNRSIDIKSKTKITKINCCNNIAISRIDNWWHPVINILTRLLTDTSLMQLAISHVNRTIHNRSSCHMGYTQSTTWAPPNYLLLAIV